MPGCVDTSIGCAMDKKIDMPCFLSSDEIKMAVITRPTKPIEMLDGLTEADNYSLDYWVWFPKGRKFGLTPLIALSLGYDG